MLKGKEKGSSTATECRISLPSMGHLSDSLPPNCNETFTVDMDNLVRYFIDD